MEAKKIDHFARHPISCELRPVDPLGRSPKGRVPPQSYCTNTIVTMITFTPTITTTVIPASSYQTFLSLQMYVESAMQVDKRLVKMTIFVSSDFNYDPKITFI